jgi:hypothetical protein
VSYRHLNDSERYRDYEFLADDGWETVERDVRPPAPTPRPERSQNVEAVEQLSVRAGLREAWKRRGSIVRRLVRSLLRR